MTVACATAPPEGSFTWQRSVPEGVCANKGLAKTGAKKSAKEIEAYFTNSPDFIESPAKAPTLYDWALNYCVVSSPLGAPPPRFQGDMNIAWLALPEEDRMASTPLSSVMAVTPPEAAPCVATIITASPFCKSASVAGGIRLRICWRSGAPPGRGPPGPPPEGGTPDRGAAGGRPPPAPAPFGGPPAAPPFNRMAII